MFTLAQTVAVTAAATDSAVKTVDMSLMNSTSYAVEVALYTWLLAAIISMGVAMMMKIIYLYIKRARIAEDAANNAK